MQEKRELAAKLMDESESCLDEVDELTRRMTVQVRENLRRAGVTQMPRRGTFARTHEEILALVDMLGAPDDGGVDDTDDPPDTEATDRDGCVDKASATKHGRIGKPRSERRGS